MMKERLESFVRNNKRDFDQFEAPADIWNKIQDQLDEKNIVADSKLKNERIVRVSFLLKIAASLVPLIIAALWFYQYQLKQSIDLSNINPQLAKEQIHYASLIEIKGAELKRIEQEEPELYREFSSEIKKMDASYQKLKNELPVSPNQEETVKAMIQNLQIQTELLNQQLQIIQQINQIKNNEKDGTQNI
jgi:flagellar biosynthesis GTPase FlhF